MNAKRATANASLKNSSAAKQPCTPKIILMVIALATAIATETETETAIKSAIVIVTTDLAVDGRVGRIGLQWLGGGRLSYKYEDEESDSARAARVEKEREEERWG